MISEIFRLGFGRSFSGFSSGSFSGRSFLSGSFLGSGFRWGELFQLNADLVKNPRRIYVGQTLRVPA